MCSVMESVIFACMESHSSESAHAHSTDGQVRQTLQDLHQDRASLAQRLVVPWRLHCVVALLVAGFVATPAIGPDTVRSVVVGALSAPIVLLPYGHRRLRGARLRRTGLPGVVLLLALLLGTLLLLSVSFGLVSLLSSWWVLAPATAGFVLVLIGGRSLDRTQLDRVRHG